MTDPFLHLGVRETWKQQKPIGLWPADRARHLHLVGQTGTGKSTLMTHLVRQDIEAGTGVTLIDPHGDLADVVCDVVPTRRIDDVAILDPTDIAYPPAFNPFYRVPIDDRARVASNWVATFKHAYPESWGPRLEHILRNAVRLVLDAPDRARPTIVAVARVLVEPGTRRLRSPTFWTDTSFLRKMLIYGAAFRAGVCKRRFGIPAFRVLTVTTNASRVEKMVDAYQRHLSSGANRTPAGLFLFTDWEHLNLTDAGPVQTEYLNGAGRRANLV